MARVLGTVVVGRYRLERLIGQGGMGEVYEALDLETRRAVAIKWLLLGGDPSAELLARFDREIRVTSTLSSRHIIGVHDAGRDVNGGDPFMVMDYLEGEDLAALATRLGPMSVDLAVRLVAQACDGMVIAHAAGVVHRDLKPSNLFLARAPGSAVRMLKILDFGIARICDRAATSDLKALTRTGAVIGSPAYMAPEQLRSEATLDHRADVWALGVVLYRLLAGGVPHARHQDSLAAMMFAICGDPAPPLLDRAPGIPRDLADVVHRALQIPRDQRTPSVQAFRDGRRRRWIPDGPSITEAMLIPRRPDAPTRTDLDDLATVTDVEITPIALATTAPLSAPLAAAPARPSSSQHIPAPSPRALRRRVRPTFVVALGFVALLTWFVVPRIRTAVRDLLAARAANQRATSSSASAASDDNGTAASRVDLPKELANTEGAAWFVAVHARCTPGDVAVLLHEQPAKHTPDGVGFTAACLALAGDLDRARQTIWALEVEQRAFAVWPIFEVMHPIADLHPYDARVGPSMRLVVEYWPENFMAMFHAGVSEFEQNDARATKHLQRFLSLYRKHDGFWQTATTLLAQLAAPTSDCTTPLATDPEGHQIFAARCAPMDSNR